MIGQHLFHGFQYTRGTVAMFLDFRQVRIQHLQDFMHILVIIGGYAFLLILDILSHIFQQDVR